MVNSTGSLPDRKRDSWATRGTAKVRSWHGAENRDLAGRQFEGVGTGDRRRRCDARATGRSGQ